MIMDESQCLHDEENLKTVVRELEHDRRFTKIQLSKGMMNRKSSETSHSHLYLMNSTLAIGTEDTGEESSKAARLIRASQLLENQEEDAS